MNPVLAIVAFYQSGGNGGSMIGFLPFIAIFAVMYFLMIRPQQKKQKQHQAMLKELKKGDKIITSGGIYGTISGIKEKEATLIVKIDENVKVELARGSVAKKLES